METHIKHIIMAATAILLTLSLCAVPVLTSTEGQASDTSSIGSDPVTILDTYNYTTPQGANLDFTVDSDLTLTISGVGGMTLFYYPKMTEEIPGMEWFTSSWKTVNAYFVGFTAAYGGHIYTLAEPGQWDQSDNWVVVEDYGTELYSVHSIVNPTSGLPPTGTFVDASTGLDAFTVNTWDGSVINSFDLNQFFMLYFQGGIWLYNNFFTGLTTDISSIILDTQSIVSLYILSTDPDYNGNTITLTEQTTNSTGNTFYAYDGVTELLGADRAGKTYEVQNGAFVQIAGGNNNGNGDGGNDGTSGTGHTLAKSALIGIALSLLAITALLFYFRGIYGLMIAAVIDAAVIIVMLLWMFL